MTVLKCFAACFGKLSDSVGRANVKSDEPVQQDSNIGDDIVQPLNIRHHENHVRCHMLALRSQAQLQASPSPSAGNPCASNQPVGPDTGALHTAESQAGVASDTATLNAPLASGWVPSMKPRSRSTERPAAPPSVFDILRSDKARPGGPPVDNSAVPGAADPSDQERDPMFDDPDEHGSASSRSSSSHSRTLSNCSLDTNQHVVSSSARCMATQQMSAAATGTSLPYSARKCGGVLPACSTGSAATATVTVDAPYPQFSRICSSSGSLQPMLPLSALPAPAPLSNAGAAPSPPRLLWMLPTPQLLGGQSPRLTVFPSLAAMLADLQDLRMLRPAAAATSGSHRHNTGGRCVFVKGLLAGAGPVVVHLLSCRALHPATGPALRTVMLAGSAVHPAIARVHGMRFVPAAAALAPGGLPGAPRPAAAVAAAAALGSPPAADWGREEAPSWLPAADRPLPGASCAGAGGPCSAGAAPISSSSSSPARPVHGCASPSTCCSAAAALTQSSIATATAGPSPADWSDVQPATAAPPSVSCSFHTCQSHLQQQQQHQHVQQRECEPALPPPQQQRLTAIAPGPQLAAVVTTLQAQLKLQPGEGILAVVCEGSPMGSLESLLGGIHNPFRPNRSWPAYMARRALLRTALEVAEALAHLHSIGFVHGALRPCHVLLVPCSRDRRNFRTKVFGACVRFVQLLSSRNSAATLVVAGDSSKSMDARCQGPGPSGLGVSGGAPTATAGGRSSSSPQPHISSAALTWPEPLPGQSGSAFLPYVGLPRFAAAAAAEVAAAAAAAAGGQTSGTSTACSPLLSTTNPWWSPSPQGLHSPPSAPGRSRRPSRVLAVAEDALSPSVSASASAFASNHAMDLMTPSAAAAARGSCQRPSGSSAFTPQLMRAMGSCPGRAGGSAAGGSSAIAPLCRTPSEGQLLGGLSFVRASRRPLCTSYAIPEHLEVEAAEAAAADGAAATAAAEAPEPALPRCGGEGCVTPIDTIPARRSHSDLVLRSPEETPPAVRSGKSSLSFTLGAAAAAASGGRTSAAGTSARLAALIRSLVFIKPGGTAAGTTAGSAGPPRQGLTSLPCARSDAGGEVGVNTPSSRRVSNPRSSAAPHSGRASSVALAAAALLSRRPSLLAAASPLSSSVVPEHETAEGLWGSEPQPLQPQPLQRRRRRRRRRGRGRDLPGRRGEDCEEDCEEAAGGEEEEEVEDCEEEEMEEVEAVLLGEAAVPPGFGRARCGQSPGRRLGAAASASAGSTSRSTSCYSGCGGWRDELFQSPESQQDPLSQVAASHDTWAFGMLLWAMAAGEPPADGQQAPGAPLSSTPGPCNLGLLTTLDLDLAIRAPPWPAHCRTHSHLQPLYQACVAKEPSSRPSMATVRARLELLERQLREEHARSNAAAAAAARSGFLLLDSHHQRHLQGHFQHDADLHHQQHRFPYNQQERLEPGALQPCRSRCAAGGSSGGASDALHAHERQQLNHHLLPHGCRPLVRTVRGDLLEVLCRSRVAPPPPPRPLASQQLPQNPQPQLHSHLYGYVHGLQSQHTQQGSSPPRGQPPATLHQHQHHQATCAAPDFPQHHPLTKQHSQHTQQQERQRQHLKQYLRQHLQLQQQRSNQQHQQQPAGLSRSLPTSVSHMYTRRGGSPL